MNTQEVTIVTAFFDIDRGKWGDFGRGSEKYFAYFKHWARIRNPLVVYTDAKYADEVVRIRQSFGLENKTRVIAVEHVEQCDADIFGRIETAMRSKYTWIFRSRLNNPESWNVKYNYIMLMKSYFISEAIRAGLAAGTIAWMDFGFDHGGESFSNAQEFDFLWTHGFSPHIHVFADRSMDALPIFEIIRNMNVYIRGNLVIANDALWPMLWTLCRQAMVHLTACGFADDDQTLLLMAYRERPDLFVLHASPSWGGALKQVGGAHLTMNALPPEPPESRGKRWRRLLKDKYIDHQIAKRKGSAIYAQYTQAAGKDNAE